MSSSIAAVAADVLQKNLPPDLPVSTSTPVLNSASGPSRILLLGADASLVAAIAKVVAEAENGVELLRPETLADALLRESQEAEVLVLCDPDRSLVDAAGAATEAAGLPRWAVIVCRSSTEPAAEESFNVVSRDEWHAPLVRRVVRSALQQHRLRRENARFRGDLTTFGFRVSHDLRTPLGGVLTTTEMLKEILGEDLPVHVPLTQPIIDSADGLVKLIERTSFVAKISASNERPMRWNMGTPFWNAFQQLEGQLLKAGATLQYPSDWPTFDGHAAWIEVVWQNLIANALQHGGPLVRIEAGWSAVKDGHCFWLQDSGSVPMERRPLLFHPFNRMHESRAPRGLGLAIVRRIVELERGYCGYETPPGGGSRFYFVLPAVRDSTSPTPAC